MPDAWSGIKIKNFSNNDAGNGYRNRQRFFMLGLVLLAASVFQFISVSAGSAEDAIRATTLGNGYAWTKLVSSDSSGDQGNSQSYNSVISADGRYVAFLSFASNLVAGDNNEQLDIFIKDTQTGVTQLVSTASDGTQGNGGSFDPSISGDGRYVAFYSVAGNLVAGDNNVGSIFIKDTQTGVTQLVSTASDGTQGNDTSDDPSISGDGRYVAFQSYASLAAGDIRPQSDIFIKDTQTGVTQLVSTASDGTQGAYGSYNPSISTDGRYVAFQSRASNGNYDIFIKDTQTGVTQLVSTASDGTQGNGVSSVPSISADGRYVAFYSTAGNLVAGDNNGGRDIFIKDTHTGVTQLVSTASDGTQGNGNSIYSSISADGRYVAFVSTAGNLVAGDNNGNDDIFIKDTQTGVTQLVSTASDGTQGNGASSYPSISGDGTLVSFHSLANTLVQGDSNDTADIFLTSNSSLFDSTPPEITNTQPNGRLARSDFTIEADLSDAGLGVDPASVMLMLVHNGIRDVTADATITADHISYNGSGYGLYTAFLLVKDNAGNEQSVQWDFDLPDISYFPWYDSLYGKTWVLIAQPSSGSVTANGNIFDVYLKAMNEPMQPLTQGIAVTQGQTQFRYYGGKIGGPVKVASDGTGLVSERSLFGNSFEEVWAASYDDLDSHYWWPVYDCTGPMKNWILVANPPENGEPVHARVNIYKNGSITRTQEKTIAPGDSWTPIFSGLSGGPVEVTAWREDGSPTEPADARKVISTQRVLYNGAFNEMPGMAASQLDSMYMWTWYDGASAGASNWVAISNPNNEPVLATVLIGDLNNPTYYNQGWVAPKQTLAINKGWVDMNTWTTHDKVMGGPVNAFGCFDEDCDELAPIVASQRLFWGPSFSEIAGTAEMENGYTTANWTWYDQQSPGAKNWVLVSNPNEAPIYAEIRIQGQTRWSGVIDPYQNKTPTFAGVMGGPVEVESWISEIDPNTGQQKKAESAPVFASQRVLWNGYFNEIVGKGL